jgi:hypothetical protein
MCVEEVMGRQTMMAWGESSSATASASALPLAPINSISRIKGQHKNIGYQVLARYPVNPGDKEGK